MLLVTGGDTCGGVTARKTPARVGSQPGAASLIWRILAGLAALFWSGVAAAAPLSAYGRLPSLDSVEISPDGQRLAYIGVTGESRRLEVQQLDGRVLASLRVGDQKVRGIEWLGPDYLMIEVTDTASVAGRGARYEFMTIVGFDVKEKTFTHFLNSEDRRGGTASRMNRGARVPRVVFGDPFSAMIDGQPAAIVETVNLDGSQSRDLFRVNLKTGEASLHERGSRDAIDFVIAPDGKVLAREEYDDDNGRWRLLMREGSGWREVMAATARLDRPSLIGFGRDGRSLLVGRLEGGERRWVEVSPDGTLSAPIDKGRRLTGVLYDDNIGRLLGVSYNDGGRDYEIYDAKLAAAWRSVKRGFPGQLLSLSSWSTDFSKLVVFAEGKGSGVYYLVDTASRKADVIGEAYPDVPNAEVATQQLIAYKAADNLEIPAYLTVPVGRSAKKNLPLVVMPHGGPESRDGSGFDWWAQALASRGYAVLQPQFRGSSGFGRAHVEAGHGQWGRKMQSDLSDGVRHLAAQGMIDPKRVCIVGASYGGYAALAGITLEPEVYRCAVSVAGLSDLPRLMTTEAREAGDRNAGPVRYLARFLGSSYRDRARLAEVSPAQQAARASGPVLLIHGRDDTVVPFDQSAVMERALHQAGKPVELVALAGEDHWLSRETTRQQMLNATVAFLEKHNPPQ